jgi:methionyl-tRNA formyltransferase
VDAGHEVKLVLTQPDRPAARGLRMQQSAVKQLALRRGLPVFQPETLKTADAADALRAVMPDALVVAAYGLILPKSVLDAVPHAINIHASLLPRWRGAAPIQRALLAGDAHTGISIMEMEPGLDTGPVLMRESLAIATDDDAQSLHDRLADLGARMIVAALRDIAEGRISAQPQDEAGATYAAKIDKSETLLDWRKSAVELDRMVRAFRPAPGARTRHGSEELKIWRARPVEGAGVPGTVLRATDALVVACGDGALEIAELQRPGGRRIAAAQFLRGRPLATGTAFSGAA